MDAFAYEPTADMVPARSGGGASLSAAASGLDLRALRAEMLVWLRFSPRVYLRDWLAGLLDRLLNGAEGARRRTQRASLADFLRACAMLAQPDPFDAEELEALREQLLVIELNSPEQARFWLHMQEERVRETEPLRG